MSGQEVKGRKRTILFIVCMVLAIVCIFPILFGVLQSFRPNDEIFAYALPFNINSIFPVEWTLENFIAIFRDYDFGRPILNTLVVVAIAIPLSVLINSISAFAFAMFDFKGKAVLLGLFMLSFMIPFDSISIPLYRIVSSLGWVNTRLALIIPSLGNGLVMLLFIQFFRDIPRSFIEAARIDGAGWIKIFFKIVLPLCVPVCITAGLMVFIEHWNSYLWPLLVAREDSIRTVQIALSDFKTEYVTSWSYIYAAASVSLVLPLTLFFPLQKYFVQGVASSGVKG